MMDTQFLSCWECRLLMVISYVLLLELFLQFWIYLNQVHGPCCLYLVLIDSGVQRCNLVTSTGDNSERLYSSRTPCRVRWGLYGDCIMIQQPPLPISLQVLPWTCYIQTFTSDSVSRDTSWDRVVGRDILISRSFPQILPYTIGGSSASPHTGLNLP